MPAEPSAALSIPDSMTAVHLVAPGQLSLVQVPVPAPGNGELLVRVRAATTCGTDLKAFVRGHSQIPMPGPFGHEYSGTVAAAGDGAKFPVGTEVMGVHSAPCQHCFWCRNGQENLCETIMETKVLGTYAEFLLIPKRIANLNVFAKPERLPFGQASLLEPLACVAQGVLELSPKRQDRILVIGPGAIGLMFVAALRHLGVESVTLAGRSRDRLAVGAQLGATTLAYDALETVEGNFDAVIECTGQPAVWERSINLPRRGGKVMLFGGCPGGTTVTFDTGRLHYDQITLLSPFHFGTQAVRDAYQWLAKDGLDLSSLLSGNRRLEELEPTLRALQASEGLKYVVTP